MKKVIALLLLATISTGFSAKAQDFDHSHPMFLAFNHENGIYNSRTEQEPAAYEGHFPEDW